MLLVLVYVVDIDCYIYWVIEFLCNVYGYIVYLKFWCLCWLREMKFICVIFVWVVCDVFLMCYIIFYSCSWKKKYKIKIFNNKLIFFWINVSFWMSDCDNML